MSKRKALSNDEDLLFKLFRIQFGHDLLEAGFSKDDKAAAAIANNDALRKVLDLRKRSGSNKGGSRTAKTYARPALDKLIRDCIERGEKTRDYSGEWRREFNLSYDALGRRVRKIKAEIAAAKKAKHRKS